MTIKELIDQLEAYPPGTRVVVRGYENGYNDVDKLVLRKIHLHKKAQWWDGRYSDSEASSAIEAVEIFGNNNII
jgi:hypothetical protein